MKYFSLLLLLTPSLAFAGNLGWTGLWLGKGVAAKPRQQAKNCREIALQLEEQPGSLKVIEGHYICSGGLQASFDPASLDVRGADLFYRGKKIGSLTRDEFRLNHEFEDGSTYQLIFRKYKRESATYTERWTENNQTVFKVDGLLRLQ